MTDTLAFYEALSRIPTQRAKLAAIMATHRYYTKTRLAQLCGTNAHAISARLSELRRQGAVFEKSASKDPGIYLYRQVYP